MINLAIIEGRLTKDIELRYTQSNKAHAVFNVACNRGKDERGNDLGADYISVEAWGKWAEMASKWFKKGDGISITGRTTTRNYDDPNVPGKKVFLQNVTADRITFPESKPQQQPQEQQPVFQQAESAYNIDRGDLPF